MRLLPPRTRTQPDALGLQYTVDSTEAGTERFCDRLDGETLFVQPYRPSSLCLRQWLTTHADTTIVKQFEHTWFRDAEPLGQRGRANARSIQLHQLCDLLLAEPSTDEPRAARFVQVIGEICRHDRREFSQLLQLLQGWGQPS